MPRIPELEYRDTERWLIPCDADDNAFFDIYWDPETNWRYAYICETRGNIGWGWPAIKYRLKDAWRAFSGREYEYREIILNEKAIDTLRDFVNSRTNDPLRDGV